MIDKEKVIKINYKRLGVSGFAIFGILLFLPILPFTSNTISIISYIFLAVICVVHLYSAFSDNEHPIKSMIYSFSYFFHKDKVIK
jgi:hypothetical protein